MGSRLADEQSGEELWPGKLSRRAFSVYSELALQIDSDTLEPLRSRLMNSGLADEVAGRDYYGKIIRVPEQAGGYRETQLRSEWFD